MGIGRIVVVPLCFGVALSSAAQTKTGTQAGKVPQRPRSPVEQRLERELCENFGGLAPRLGAAPKMPDMATSWFKYIKSLETKGTEVWVDTTLHADADATEPARSICSAVSGFLFSNDNKALGLNGVRVAAKDGQRLVYRRGVGAKCE